LYQIKKKNAGQTSAGFAASQNGQFTPAVYGCDAVDFA
jgi:hypothetical protein